LILYWKNKIRIDTIIYNYDRSSKIIDVRLMQGEIDFTSKY